ncbi:hypothetical protein HYU17_00875 [Candidatus Woesearchaeota archaeon]|nr:hypothetical protein [Candidatus Woesearchaeota archaeon]
MKKKAIKKAARTVTIPGQMLKKSTTQPQIGMRPIVHPDAGEIAPQAVRYDNRWVVGSSMGNHIAPEGRGMAPLKKSKIRYTMEPLPATFTLIALLGMIITTVFTVSGRIDISWGVAFDLVFGAMLTASMLSITPDSPN